jgi:cation transport ATPase
MTDLTLIDFIIFDKTMTLTIPSFKIRNIIIQDKSFYINNKIFK